MSTNQIETCLKDEGINRFGFCELKRPLSFDYYDAWLKNQYQATMDYLVRHRDQKETPQKLKSFARSAVVVAVDYLPHPSPESKKWKGLKVARYAQGGDYHNWLKGKLEAVVARLKVECPGEEFAVFTDSAPVLERDLAYRAGLGWFGKNTCLIDQKAGSFFLIGEIYTSLDLKGPLDFAPDRCGTCTRCIEACPTGALLEPHILDSRRCISFHTIESKTLPPLELRDSISDLYFGCDICQTVCPWNIKAFGPASIEIQNDDEVSLIDELRMILVASNKQLEIFFEGTPLLRTPGYGHKRNALVVIANRGLNKLRPEVESLRTHERLGELADWCLKKLDLCPN